LARGPLLHGYVRYRHCLGKLHLREGRGGKRFWFQKILLARNTIRERKGKKRTGNMETILWCLVYWFLCAGYPREAGETRVNVIASNARVRTVNRPAVPAKAQHCAR
jgi:hypothetical protein